MSTPGFIRLLTCAHGRQALALASDAAADAGTRITGNCCGSWTATKTWSVDLATIRDDIDAIINAPRDLARSEADVVAAEPMADVLTELLKTKLGEWGVRTTYSDDETAPDVRWYAGDTAEREARTFYAELRGKTNCECGAEIDEDDAIVTDDGPVCDDCAAALHEEWLAAAVACVGVNGGKADEPCGWTGKGADARAVGGDSRRRKCPACGGEVELTEGDDAAVPS